MSLNSYHNVMRRQYLVEMAVMDDYGLGHDNLSQILHDAKEEKRYISRPTMNYTLRSGHTVHREETVVVDHHHLIQEVQQAARALARAWWPEKEEWEFGYIPYNFATPDHSPWGGWNFYNSRRAKIRMEKGHAEVAIDGYLRTAGFLRATARSRLPALKKVLEKTQGNGANSPYTYFSVFSLATKLRSPGRAERLLWKVKKRAEAILFSYDGDVSPSWRSIAEALLITQQIGKAAVIAVAGTVSGKSFPMYRKAREWLVDYHRCCVKDSSDGVNVRREEKPCVTKLGISVYRIAMPELTRRGHQVGIDFNFLVSTQGGRTYHSLRWGNPHLALREAVQAWREQDRLAEQESEVVEFLNGEELGFCPLITRIDSTTAGNCLAGTNAWVSRNGWGGREFIPGMWLLPHLYDEQVKRVVKAARERCLRQVA